MPFIDIGYCSTLQRCREVADRNGIVIRRRYKRQRPGAAPAARYEVVVGGRVMTAGDAKVVKAFMYNLDLPGKSRPAFPPDDSAARVTREP